MGRREAMGGASKAVAIKLLAPHLAENPVYRRMFVDEARLTMMLTHSNIVQVFDVGEQGGRSYLVMEWVDGLDLSRLAGAMRDASTPFDFGVVAHVIGEVLRGLAYAHNLVEGDETSTIVHRDISPHNVLISVSGEVKVSDFGVARLASEETSGLHVRGKLRYMPPEQVRGESKHATIDLFAVGAMLQELLDGLRFRAGFDRDALFGMVISGDVPPLRRRDVPHELRALRDKLLTADRHARIQSASEALALLRCWPGYRHCADQLAQLVRDRAGVDAPRSGLTVAFSDEELEAIDEPTVREGSAVQSSSDLETRTVPSDEGGLASDTTPRIADAAVRDPAAVDGQAARSSAAGLGRRLPVLIGIALACLGAALGFGFSWFGGSIQADEQRAAISEEAIVAAPPPAEQTRNDPPVLAHSDVPRSSVANPAQAAEAQASEAQASEAQAAESDPVTAAPPSKPPAKARGPAKVEFAASEFFFVWIKVGGREHALEPVAKLSLRPGSHKVYLRESTDQPWRSAGRIKVDAGQRYRVVLRKPAGLSLQHLN